ncbi:MAG: thiamine phosphate synthase [Acidiferrobacterales bacterium]
MNSASAICGLYVIADTQVIVKNLIDSVAAAIEGGARVVQYRDKSNDTKKRQREATALCALCQQHDIPFIVNDDVDLAQQSEAAGVHLGKHDGAIETAREQLGNNAIIGISCYNELELAHHAAVSGANYIAFGSFYSSPVKPDAVVANSKLLTQAKQELSLPMVAIGGITPENGAELISSGADSLAVISGVFSTNDIRSAAQSYAVLFTV